MSRHHENEINTTTRRDSSLVTVLTLFTQDSPPRTKHRAPPEAISGHGLFSTKWNGLNFSIIYLISVVYSVISVMNT